MTESCNRDTENTEIPYKLDKVRTIEHSSNIAVALPVISPQVYEPSGT